MGKPSCFISYSWDSRKHKEWVRKLATHLQRNGVLTHLDQWDVRPGMDLPDYVERCIRESHFVILVCTPKFAVKANAGAGGVGYEKMIVTGEMFTQATETTKFVPVLRSGEPDQSIPSYLKSRVFVDVRHDSELARALDSLIRHMFDRPELTRPDLGPPPDLVREDPLQSLEFSDAIGSGPDGISYDTLCWVAESPRYLALSRDAAARWARYRVGLIDKRNFGAFVQAVSFARDPEILGLRPEEAAEWAEARMDALAEVPFPEFLVLYQRAASKDGLDMAPEDAADWALDHAADGLTGVDWDGLAADVDD